MVQNDAGDLSALNLAVGVLWQLVQPLMGMNHSFRLAGRARCENNEGRSVSLALERRRDSNRLCGRSAARVAPAHRFHDEAGSVRQKPGGGPLLRENFPQQERCLVAESDGVVELASATLWILQHRDRA